MRKRTGLKVLSLFMIVAMLVSIINLRFNAYADVDGDRPTFVVERVDGQPQQYVLVNGEYRAIFCMQHDYLWPTDTLSAQPGTKNPEPTHYYEANADEMYLNGDQLAVIRRLLFAGFPYDSVGVMEPIYKDPDLSYMASESAARMTQEAVWALMAQWGIPANTPQGPMQDVSPSMLTAYNNLLNYALSGVEYPAPAGFSAQLIGSTEFTRQGDADIYQTGSLTFNAPSNFKLRYDVVLPDGVLAYDSTTGADLPMTFDFVNGQFVIYTTVYSNEPFYLQAFDTESINGTAMTFASSAKVPTDVKQYMTNDTGWGSKEKDENGVDKYAYHPYQTMLSVGIQEIPFNGIATLIAPTEESSTEESSTEESSTEESSTEESSTEESSTEESSTEESSTEESSTEESSTEESSTEESSTEEESTEESSTEESSTEESSTEESSTEESSTEESSTEESSTEESSTEESSTEESSTEESSTEESSTEESSTEESSTEESSTEESSTEESSTEGSSTEESSTEEESTEESSTEEESTEESSSDETEASTEETESSSDETEASTEETESSSDETDASSEETESSSDETEASTEETESSTEESETEESSTEESTTEEESAIDPNDPSENGYGSLRISKTVTGNLGDTNKYFTFTVVFNSTGSYAYSGSKSGMIKSGDSIQLKHGEYIVINNIPSGTAYSVYESNNEGYSVTITGGSGVIVKDAVVTAAFNNNKSSAPVTGDNTHVGLWISIFGASLMNLIVLMLLMFKKSKATI